jgi:hypothetical protein
MKQTSLFLLFFLIALASCNKKKNELKAVTGTPTPPQAQASATPEEVKKLEGVQSSTLSFPLYQLQAKNPGNTLITVNGIKEAFSPLYPETQGARKAFLEKLFNFETSDTNPAFTSENSSWFKKPLKNKHGSSHQKRFSSRL